MKVDARNDKDFHYKLNLFADERNDHVTNK